MVLHAKSTSRMSVPTLAIKWPLGIGLIGTQFRGQYQMTRPWTSVTTATVIAWPVGFGLTRFSNSTPGAGVRPGVGVETVTPGNCVVDVEGSAPVVNV